MQFTRKHIFPVSPLYAVKRILSFQPTRIEQDSSLDVFILIMTSATLTSFDNTHRFSNIFAYYPTITAINVSEKITLKLFRNLKRQLKPLPSPY